MKSRTSSLTYRLLAEAGEHSTISAAEDVAEGPVAGGCTVVDVAGEPATNADYLGTVCRALGVEPVWEDGPAWTGQIRTDRARGWGWSPRVSRSDALAELEIPPGGAMAVQMRRYDRFAKAESHLAWSVLDALETTSRRLLLTGRRLLTLVQSDDPRIKFERVGAMPVNWNPREWLESDRGIGGGPPQL